MGCIPWDKLNFPNYLNLNAKLGSEFILCEIILKANSLSKNLTNILDFRFIFY